ncbi:hypothetical protein SAMN05660443_1966 [Marinospirillum celere]|uniref:Uncharacterized protein n=1 Tax=Marinospirillum celere TaxID=1122252 RepID=A0A1I1HW83_9GAMM|nr:hypothetical protein [Marinospirillum celere]SFC26228.1 hypothetical protein SAMN05660443_1966 [Marinospirillum celere]
MKRVLTSCMLALGIFWGTWVLAEDELTLSDEPLETQEDTEAELQLLEADPNEMSLQELKEEVQLLKDLQAGLAITLAACEDEPHCVTAFTEQEIDRMLDEIQRLIGKLEGQEKEYHELLDELQQVETEYSHLQTEFIQVAATIDRDSLEGNWADQFVFDDFDLGPDVPYPNEHVTLNMFEDAHKPLPIE